MRLTPHPRQAIKKHFLEVFKEGEIYLFGSRVDDTKRGGDIDLYLVVPNLKGLAIKRVEFLVALKRDIGEQKIDVVFDRGQNRAIDQIAKEQGVRL
jgi:predicted nucleotidyltransferase